MPFCYYCGVKIEDGDAFCCSCGKRVVSTASAGDVSSSAAQKTSSAERESDDAVKKRKRESDTTQPLSHVV